MVENGPKVIKVTSPTSQMRRVYLEPLNTNVNLINARQLSTWIRVLPVTMQIVTKPTKLHPGNLKEIDKATKKPSSSNVQLDNDDFDFQSPKSNWRGLEPKFCKKIAKNT